MKPWLYKSLFALALALGFFAYLRPDFAFDLANRIYLCF